MLQLLRNTKIWCKKINHCSVS